MTTARDIICLLRRDDWTIEEHTYLRHHAARIAYTVDLVAHLHAERGVRSLLDVGPHLLSTALRQLLPADVALSTLGWANPRMAPGDVSRQHVAFDLNTCDTQAIPCTERFDAIVFAETIEHLHIAPQLVLRALAGLLTADGTLIVQTPNAVSLAKRLKMLAGRHPYELLREDRHNPGHIRESTLPELVRFGAMAGLMARLQTSCDFQPHRLWPVRWLSAAVPTLREGLVVCFGRTPT